MIPPIETPDLIGHSEIEAQIFRLVKQDKLPHALLLTGPKGIGKSTFAYRLARYLLVGAKTETPVMGLFGEEPVAETLATDMEQPAIQRMITGSHGDLLIVQPEFDEKKKTSLDTIFVPQVRQVVEFMQRTPSESAWRVVIVDPAEAMNTNAANALLKVLEEPPSQTVLILVSHQPGRLLPTIRSRCRLFSFQPPKVEEAHEIFEEQQLVVEGDALAQLLQLTQNSAGQAMQFHQHDALLIYQQMLACLLNPQPQAVQKLAGEAAKASAEKWPVMKAMLLQLLYRLVLFSQASEQFKALYADEAAAFLELQKRHPILHWMELWERAERMLQDVTTLTMDKKQTMLSVIFSATAQRNAA